MAEKKEEKYVSDDARLMAEWDWEKNNELGFDPSQLTCGSHKKVWWKCLYGHEWDATIKNRNKGQGCPYCVGRKVLKGYNDLQTLNPVLAEEWNCEKNDDLSPEDFTANSSKKVWWKCSKGHEWQATIDSRTKGNGCPYCSNRKVLKGYNDLLTVNPGLTKEWNYEKNGELTPMDVTPNSDKKVWWKCSQGHEWQSTINNKTKGKGCPYCSGRCAIKDENDLQTVNPILAKEWNYERNVDVTPVDVLPNSNKKVWWKCSKGHEWQATVSHRNTGRGCPICNSERNTSFPEYAFMYYFQKYDLDVIHSYRGLGYELDLYIPSKKVAIEYDGCFWHKNKTKKDIEKNIKCENDGIKLYRIREGLPSLSGSSIDYITQGNQQDLEKAIKEILTAIIGICVDVNLERDAIEIENLREYTEKTNSILHSNPQIAQEWNYEKNGNLKPENLLANSNKKVWWKCVKGHEWQAVVCSRNSGCGCPYCSNRKVLKGYNDLLTVNPGLARDWNYEKNGDLTPMDVMPNSDKKVWWKCNKGHEWQARLQNRNNGKGCPVCAKEKRKKSKSSK